LEAETDFPPVSRIVLSVSCAFQPQKAMAKKEKRREIITKYDKEVYKYENFAVATWAKVIIFNN